MLFTIFNASIFWTFRLIYIYEKIRIHNDVFLYILYRLFIKKKKKRSINFIWKYTFFYFLLIYRTYRLISSHDIIILHHIKIRMSVLIHIRERVKKRLKLEIDSKSRYFLSKTSYRYYKKRLIGKAFDQK